MSYFGSTATLQYNSRLQMTHLTVPGQLNINYNFATQNNDQVSSQTDNLSGEQITYQYDALKRLYSATGSGWSQTFTYDGFGNLTDKVGTGGAPTNHSPVNAATNRLTGSTYDANGNLITTGFGWDPENRMSYATSGGAQYAYDSANKQVWTGNYTCPGGFCSPGNGWQFQSETIFFYGIDGQRLASYTPQVKYSNGIPQFIYYLLGEQRVYFGKYIGNANTSMMSGGTAVFQDRLGSTGKYFPYGEERNNPQLPNDLVKFATYTRDSATGLDYADQRYYNSGLGQFLGPDPLQGSARSTMPQSWNRYTYGVSDPINSNDPTGLCSVLIAGDTMGPGSSGNSSALTNEADTLGSVTAFPYNGDSSFGDIGRVMSQAVSPNDSTAVALSAIRSALRDNTGSIDIVAYSGGAGAFKAAYGQLTQDEQSRIGSVLYLSPGVFGTITVVSGPTSVVQGSDYKDFLATMGAIVPLGTPITTTGCIHTDLPCLMRAASTQLSDIESHGKCAFPYIFMKNDPRNRNRNRHRVVPPWENPDGWNVFSFLGINISSPGETVDPGPPSVIMGYQ